MKHADNVCTMQNMGEKWF